MERNANLLLFLRLDFCLGLCLLLLLLLHRLLLNVAINRYCILLLLLGMLLLLLLHLHTNSLHNAVEQIAGLIATQHTETFARVIDGILDEHLLVALRCALVQPVAEYRL